MIYAAAMTMKIKSVDIERRLKFKHTHTYAD
jgi:hypothetical protein